MTEQKTLSLSELSEYIGVKRRTLYLMIQDGRFSVESIKGTKPRRWNVEDIDKWRFEGQK